MKTLSIVTICYNDLSGLKKTVQSLMAQKNYDFEHWIIDGDSNDGTTDYLRQLNVPWIVHWLSERDRGLYDAMNKGTQKASGKYIWFLNSGDTAENPNVVQSILESLNQSKPNLLYGKAWYISKYDKKLVGKEVQAKDFICGMPICHQASIYKKDLLVQFPYSLDYRIISDWLVTEQIFKINHCQFIDKTFANFYLDGISAKNQLKLLSERLRSLESKSDKVKVLLTLGVKFYIIFLLSKMNLYPIYLTSRNLVRRFWQQLYSKS